MKHKISISRQRSVIIDALKEVAPHGITTISFREDFDVMAPSQRITELKRLYNLNIQTIMQRDINAQGQVHRCACYYLRAGPFQKRLEDLSQIDLFN